MSSCIARASLWRRLGQSSGPYTGPVVNLPRPERRLLSYGDRPSRQTLITLLSQRLRLAVHSTAIWVVNQSESIYKILKPVLALAHLHRVKLHMYIGDSLLNPGTHQEALEQTSWLKSLCRKLGSVFKPREVGSNPFSGCHVSGDRAGHLCRPSKAVTQEVDQLASVAEGFTAQQSPPAVQWLQVLGHLVSLEKLVPYGRIHIRPIQWQLRLQWSQSKEKSSKLIPLDLQSRLAILGWTNRDNLRRGVPIGTIDVEYYLYTDSSTQGWGAHLQD